jgi:hypothetical protein
VSARSTEARKAAPAAGLITRSRLIKTFCQEPADTATFESKMRILAIKGEVVLGRQEHELFRDV